MNLRQLELFLAVVDAGGFTAAAARLRVAQPAVSAAVRRLEEELGARLLVRGARRLTLTAEGAAFLRHARAILAQVAASRHEIAAMRALEAGHFSIGAPPMVAGHLLPRVVDRFLSERPGLRLSVVQAGAEEIGARVLRGDLDLGIVADWRTPEGLAVRLLEVHPMVACVAAPRRSPDAGASAGPSYWISPSSCFRAATTSAPESRTPRRVSAAAPRSSWRRRRSP